MNAEYYGWLGAKGYDTVIKIEDYDAYVYRTVEQKFVKNNDFLKAKWDPGSEFEANTKKEADKIIDRIKRGLKNNYSINIQETVNYG